MQKNEIIIKQFVKTIKESPLDVKGDPALLGKVFESLDKKKKRRKFLQIFLLIAFVFMGLSFATWGIYYRNEGWKGTDGMIGLVKHPVLDVQNSLAASKDIKEKHPVPLTKQGHETVNKKRNDHFTNVVSYKFRDHQIDIVEKGTEEFIQINIFGMDGGEKDFFKIIEDLKRSYTNNEVYVDSVRHE